MTDLETYIKALENLGANGQVLLMFVDKPGMNPAIYTNTDPEKLVFWSGLLAKLADRALNRETTQILNASQSDNPTS